MIELLNKREPNDFWITTNDNPFDPFLEFEKWYNFDEKHGYKTCERIARMTNVDWTLMTEMENRIELGRAINFLVDLFSDVDLYRVVFKGEGRVVGVPAHLKDLITPANS